MVYHLQTITLSQSEICFTMECKPPVEISQTTYFIQITYTNSFVKAIFHSELNNVIVCIITTGKTIIVKTSVSKFQRY